ncbi:hemagglutinin repeat-containing protein [Megasphaera sp.]|uniref:hemagglutinin repeat-containing protein n=1 Tax=Megasphaera sp. TaxID=2023260 RepID=UPI003520D914
MRIVVKIYYELTFYRGEWKTQVGSTLASTGGSLTLAAGDTAHLTTADIFGRQGVTLTGREVLIDGATNEAHEKRTHEESRSGLSLSLSNSAISAGETFRGAVRTAQSRDNKTLQGLELVDAGRNLRKDLKGKSPADVTSVGLHVGIGSSSFKQESEVNQQTYAGGRMMSAGDVTVRSESSQENKGNLTAVGESIQGKNVSLTASGSVRLQTGTNEETIRDSYQSHGASIGASFHGGLTSIDASYGKMKDQGTTMRVTHTGSQATAQDSLMTSSGKDTTLVGSQLQGQSVTVKTGGNLHIESVQDSETYRGHRSSAGISVAYSPSVDVQENFLPQGTHATHFTYTGTGAKSGNASYSRGKTTSDYASVTEQAGIYAGDQGYDVDVNKDTQLKGAVIASTADANRNHLTTGTLHLEDIQNKAAYDVKNTGVAYNHYASDQERNQHFNETGLTPDILPGAAKDAHSVTRSAISQGTIQVTQGVTDVTKINRDTAHALQTLDHIFDKQKVEERQELARLFAKNADELLHYYDRDGKFDKALAHGLVAEITSQIAGNKAGSGFAAGMTNELLINKIKEWAGNDPAKAQWISAALGATVNAATGKNVQTGGATAQYGTKWNTVLTNNPGLYAYYDNFQQAKDDLIEFVSNEDTSIIPDNDLSDLEQILSMKEKLFIYENRDDIPIATEMTWAASLGKENYTFELDEDTSIYLSRSPKLQKMVKNYIYYNGTGIKDNIFVFSKDLIFTLSDVKEELDEGEVGNAWIDFGATLGLHRAAMCFEAVYQGNNQYYVYGIVGDKYKFRDSDTGYKSLLGILNGMGTQWERRGTISPTNEFIEFQFMIEVPDE